jgi:hypothetical protein
MFLALKMEAVDFAETLVPVYQITCVKIVLLLLLYFVF